MDGDWFEEIRDTYRTIARTSGATLTRGQADILWLIDALEQERERVATLEAGIRRLGDWASEEGQDVWMARAAWDLLPPPKEDPNANL